MIKVSPKIITALLKQNKLKHYAVWLHLKNIFSNSCFYKFSYRSLSQKSGMSRTALKRYIPFFLDEMWCEMHSGNLIFRKQQWIFVREMKEPAKKLVRLFRFHNTVQSTLNALHAFILATGERQRRFARMISGDATAIYPRQTDRSESIPVENTVKRCARLLHKKPRNANRVILNLQRKERWFDRFNNWFLYAEDVGRETFQAMKAAGQFFTPAFFWRNQIVGVMPSLWLWLISPDQVGGGY